MTTAGTPFRTDPTPSPTEFPSPRDGLDSGSVAELVEDSREIHLPHFTAVRPDFPHVDIDVPDDAAALVRGLGDYGF